jgi:hypothetical protein
VIDVSLVILSIFAVLSEAADVTNLITFLPTHYLIYMVAG